MVDIRIEGREKLPIIGEIVLSRRKQLSEGIRKEMDIFGLKLVRTSKSDYLSGPRPEKLGVVTGRLRNSINAFVDEMSPNEFKLSFGTNVVYAPIHEYGGVAGRKHKTIIRKRPFLHSAWGDEYPGFRSRLESLLTEIAGRLTTNG